MYALKSRVMSDTQNGQDPMTDGKPVETMPVSEQPAVETQVPPQEASTASEGDLPSEVSERTRVEFDKLKEHNKALAEELKQYKTPQQPRPQSALEELTPMVSENQYPPVQEPIEQTLPVDKDGYLDEGRLSKTLSETRKAAQSAEERAKKAEERVARFEQTQETKVTHQAFPQLDPYSQNFDPKFHHLVKLELVSQMMKGEKDFMKAAKTVSELYMPISTPPPAAQIVNKVEPTVNQNVVKRDQINAQTSVNKTAQTEAEYQQLVKGTIAGNRSAIYQRLKASGY